MIRNRLWIALAALLLVLAWLTWGPAPAAPPTEAAPAAESSPTPETAAGPPAEMVLRVPDDARAMSEAAGEGVGGPGSAAPSTADAPLRGVVKELGGPVAPDVFLELVDPAGVVLATTTSDGNGRFAFDVAAAAGAALIAQTADRTGPRTRHALPRRRPGSRGAVDVGIWIPPPHSIEGVVIDADGWPVAGAMVRTDRATIPLTTPSWKVLDGPEVEFPLSVETDAEGRFRLPSARRGAHRLRASLDGREGSTRCEAGDRAVTIRLGSHLGGAVILEGRLTVRGSGQPVAGARVSVMRVRRWASGSSSTGVATAVTDAQGRYAAPGLEGGTYAVRASPPGYARTSLEARCEEPGHHTVDLTLDPARELEVRVVEPDGITPAKVSLQVLDAEGTRLEVLGPMSIPESSLRVDEDGRVRLRKVPAAPVLLRAVRGDLLPCGELRLDLTVAAPASATVVMPTPARRLARTHFFKLLGPDDAPVDVDGVVLAECYDGDQLVSRVEGRWRGEQFEFGHEARFSFDEPTIAVRAPEAACRVVISVPGHETVTLTLEPAAVSPTTVRLPR